ncbi:MULTISPECIES: hypothetical protein [Actinoalloteichus]|uniref:Uncharacterized protein n=1 Tax=Actinoalloteichus fjordicus TaxID=1612552 RepID=A0AAC9PUW7_9PSEU|nr:MULTISPECIES: hypothetical protein [Actinoalloteichus]APU17557.1 hypothetical protein UA74_27780 [Actinoalloteichus fjordicus]APU23635.1 hypothetical protein UA75_28320 [Actinoalloteichus sp. GBA129-24]
MNHLGGVGEDPRTPGRPASWRREVDEPMDGEPQREPGRHRRGRPPGGTRFEEAAVPFSSAPPPIESLSSASFSPAEPVPVGARPFPEPDPVIDSDAVGLRKFDLGMVPASVTPPRSWRNAAWFTVTTSMTALAALLVTTALFLGPDPHRRPPDSLPVFPSGTRLPAPQATTTTVPTIGAPHLLAAQDSTTATNPAEPTSAGSGTSAGRARQAGADPEGPPPGGSAGGSGAPQPAETDSTTDLAATPTAVPFVTVGEGTPVVSGTEIREQTIAFFNAIGPDVDAAFKLVTGELAEAGLPVFTRLHDDVATVELRHITVDPVEGITISTVVVTHDDGSQSTEYRELRFAPSADPLITVDRVIPRAQW